MSHAVDCALDAIFARADMLAPHDDAIGDWLESVRVDLEDSIDILVGYLAATLWCKHQKRISFAARVRARLDVIAPGRSDVLLHGLADPADSSGSR